MAHVFIRPGVQEMLDAFKSPVDSDQREILERDFDYDPQTAWPKGRPSHPQVLGALQIEERNNVIPFPRNISEATGRQTEQRFRLSRMAVAKLALAASVLLGSGGYLLYKTEVDANAHRQQIADCMSEVRGYQIYLNANTPDGSGNLLTSDDPSSEAVKKYEDAVGASNNAFGTFEQQNSAALLACEGSDGDITRAHEIINHNR